MNSFDALEKANILYQNKKFTQAAEAYSKIATELYVDDENSDLGEIAMKLAIESYRNIFEAKLLYNILKQPDEILFSQFFSIRCYLDDHQIEKDRSKIEKKIHRSIPLNIASKKFLVHNQVIATQPNKLFTATYRYSPYQATIVAAQGPREKMEDFYFAADFATPKTSNIRLFVVFDGHGGDGCVKFAKNQLKKQLILNLNTESDFSIYNSLTQVCVLIDKNWKEYVTRPSSKIRDASGCAVVFALIIEKDLWIVSVGDSRAVLGKGSEAIQLSEDAKPPIKKYYLEIMKRGGFVKWKRVDGSLDMARSIGDIDHPSVSAKPCIRKVELDTLDPEKTNILILATDGLWDVIGSKEAITICQNTKSPKIMAAELISAAYTNGSTDNVTVMAIKL
jgi:serine/threonine protein phosphatase PrpC